MIPDMVKRSSPATIKSRRWAIAQGRAPWFLPKTRFYLADKITVFRLGQNFRPLWQSHKPRNYFFVRPEG
jgi:hypothetical protein